MYCLVSQVELLTNPNKFNVRSNYRLVEVMIQDMSSRYDVIRNTITGLISMNYVYSRYKSQISKLHLRADSTDVTLCDQLDTLIKPVCK